MKKSKKKFDFGTNTNKATIIDCLDCEHYYTGACDANAGGCNAYTPTRSIKMAEDIKSIKNTLSLLYSALLGVFCLVCAVLVCVL